jgi:ISXO2-like transposase domain
LLYVKYLYTMPPANRHEPKRAKSSRSDYSVTEFLAEFPDDAACLEHLWRTRFSPDGEHAECPKCDREGVADHRVINHSAGVYVRGDIHTNSIEGCFGNLKTGMRGTYKKVSHKWLQSYLDEYAWRYNQRFRGQRSMFHMLVEGSAK